MPLHHGNESRPGQSELGSGSTPSANNPIGFTKRRCDVRPLSVGKRPNWRKISILCPMFRRQQVQRRARRHDHGAFDGILQFSNIARPIMTNQNLHHLMGTQ